MILTMDISKENDPKSLNSITVFTLFKPLDSSLAFFGIWCCSFKINTNQIFSWKTMNSLAKYMYSIFTM